eukprot:TRINITY_DN7141_c0_g1_i4.p1 TRINITY_DN7141_c0_g1~~TRINITY_DN7141_c0_g1_i4.p1  ORF type:complete len:217 (+),score=47.79 TRINITY_DN7141_c0_g1_i4:202-852(+)
MRFMRGSKVEVLGNREVPSGAWRKAEILLGNGHYYRVKYDQPLSDSDDAIVERVSRKVIRPCPPARYTENWVAGDIVEVFDNNSWKISKVLGAVGGDCFFVRLLGSSLDIKVHKSGIRARQSWKDDQWVVIGKVSRCCEDGEAEKLPTEKYYQKPNYQVLDQDVPRKASSGRMKRGSEFSSAHVETLMEAGWKKRAIERESRCSQLVLEHPLREKG